MSGETTSSTVTADEATDRTPDISGERSAAAIEIDELTKRFNTDSGEFVVFEDVDISIEPGSFVSLLGKSGSGKSTILKIVSAVLEPTSGRVRFVPENDEDDEGDVEVGQVFQEPRLLPWNTCIENIEYVHENNPDYTDDLARQHLDMVDLADHATKYPTQLSGGQKQRVGIARAFSIDPGVLLMDEPFSNLDEITAQALREELMNIWTELRKTVFFVTHDIDEAIELSDRILMLGEGRIYNDIEVPLDRPREVDSEEFLTFRQEAIDAFHRIDGE